MKNQSYTFQTESGSGKRAIYRDYYVVAPSLLAAVTKFQKAHPTVKVRTLWVNKNERVPEIIR